MIVNFTKQERLIINFLAGAIVLGTGISIYRNFIYTDEVLVTAVEEEVAGFSDRTASIQDSVASVSLASGKQSDSLITALVNINTAGKDELISLPKIGPVSAERIIRYREEFGNFNDIDELKNVKGIGTKTVEGLRNMVTL